MRIYYKNAKNDLRVARYAYRITQEWVSGLRQLVKSKNNLNKFPHQNILPRSQRGILVWE